MSICTLALIKSHILALLFGMALVFGKAFVSDKFKAQEEKRKANKDLVSKLINTISDATANAYKSSPSFETKQKMFRISAQLEVNGESELASLIRDFTNKWIIYSEIDLPNGRKASNNEQYLRQSRDKLDNISNEIFNTRF